MLFFEPPQVAAYRMWLGIIESARSRWSPRVDCVVAAIGNDPGEPDHLEQIRMLVENDRAVVRFRDHSVRIARPARLPSSM